MEELNSNISGQIVWLSPFYLSFIFAFVCLVSLIRKNREHFKKQLQLVPAFPSPQKLPIIGHLHLLDGNIFEKLTGLSEKYGEIFSLQLGSIDSVVVNSFRLMKQVLVEKGADFGDRPNFLRYNVLFGNDRDNSLAFCDWSQVQKTRRALARRFCHSAIFADKVEESMSRTTSWLVDTIQMDTALNNNSKSEQLKMCLNKACANVFYGYFCSEYYENKVDKEFDDMVRMFDEIFWEINQSHPTDVLPWLAPFFRSHLKHIAGMGISIRKFVVERIINPHLENLDKDNPKDFVDILLTHLQDEEPESRLNLEQVLYELEDFIGGHSAVANLLVRALVEIAAVPGYSQKMYQKFSEEKSSDFLKAVIYETLRKTSSPIVPHIASVDSNIDGYSIRKGTMILFNNYDLNTNAKYWKEPQKFMPERFLSESGTFRKPAHFLPFSTGKRSCMGYKLVERTAESLIKAIIENFDLISEENPTILTHSCIALHPDLDIRIKFILRGE